MNSQNLLFYPMVLPHVVYYSSFMFSLNLNSLGRLQNILITPIRREQENIMSEALNLMNARQRIVLKKLDFIHKITHAMLHKYLSEDFTFVSEIHHHDTRSRENFFVDTFRTSLPTESTLVKGLLEYNSQTKEIKCASINSTFKRLLISFVKEHHV